MNFRMTVEADNIKDLKQRLIEAAMAIEGAEVTHSHPNLNHQNFVPYDPKTEADKQLKEQASIHEMYAAEPDVDNSVEDVEIQEIKPGLNNIEYTERSNVDSKNIPWDSRIHAASKATNKDGSWRYRRNIEEDYIKKIEAELLGETKVTETVPVQPVVAPVFQPVQPPLNVAAPQTTSVQPVIAATTVAAKPVHSAETFKKNFLMVMGELSVSGKLTPEYLNQLKDFFGVKEIWEIMKDENKVTQIYNQFVTIGLIEGV